MLFACVTTVPLDVPRFKGRSDTRRGSDKALRKGACANALGEVTTRNLRASELCATGVRRRRAEDGDRAAVLLTHPDKPRPDLDKEEATFDCRIGGGECCNFFFSNTSGGNHHSARFSV
jgi:hypothetical protein